MSRWTSFRQAPIIERLCPLSGSTGAGKQVWLWCLLLAGFVLFTVSAEAIPVFAKRYNKSCNTCHSYVPQLHRFGELFKLNGYNFPGTNDELPVWEEETAPLALMAHAMVTFSQMNHQETTNIQATSIGIFSGGTLGKSLGYFAEAEMEVAGHGGGGHHGSVEAGGHAEAANEGVEWRLGQAFGTFGLWRSSEGSLNLRVGLFELLLPFSQRTTLTGHNVPYFVYNVSPAREGQGFRLGSPQAGISAYGYLYPAGILYEAAVVNGSNDIADVNQDKDFYFRLAKDFDAQRIGGFFYIGKEQGNNSFQRYGADLNLSFRLGQFHINPYVQLLVGKDDRIVEAAHHEEGSGHNEGKTNAEEEEEIEPGFEFRGGFAGIEINVLPKKLALFARGDLIQVDKQFHEFTEDQVTGWMAGFQYHFMPNFFLNVQYSWQENGLGVMELTHDDEPLSVYGVMPSERKMLMAMLNWVF